MINTMTSYKLISSNLTRSLTRVAAEPVVQRDTDYYLKNIGKVKTIDDFMKDDRLYKYALKAIGLEDMAFAKASTVKVSLPTTIDTLTLRQQVNDFGIHSSSLLTKAMEEAQEQLVRANAVSGGISQQPLPPLSNTEMIVGKVGSGPDIANSMVTHAKQATMTIVPKYFF